MSYLGRSPQSSALGDITGNTVAVTGNSSANIVSANTVAFTPGTAPNLPEGDVYYDSATHQLKANTGTAYVGIGGSLDYADPNHVSINIFD
jgi:hypothetical protein